VHTLIPPPIHPACYLPPTFQSWFTVTNVHIWLLTTRLRALPAEHGRHYHQALIDHFFIDIEDRIRTVLQPPPTPTKPYTFASAFYVNPNAPAPNKKRSRAPDRIVTRQMKIFKEQWSGMGIAFDLGLVRGDAELAGAVWRNLLGARGAAGIDYAGEAAFRRAVNLVGGEVVDVAKVDWEREARKDDASGVHDFPPSEVDKYLTYPEVMRDVVAYCRRELKRLEGVSDEDIMSGDFRKLRFGRVREGQAESSVP
jgi:cytochrome b pre-mRNA-processing protein 3